MSSNDEMRLVSSRKRHDGGETDTGTGTGSANLDELRYGYHLPDGHSNGDSSRNGNENAPAAGTSSIYASSSRSSPLSTVNSSIASPAQLSPYLSTSRSPPNNPQQQAHAASPSVLASTTVGPELLQSVATSSLPSHTHTLTPHVHEVPGMTSAGPAMPSHTDPDGSPPRRVDVIDLTNEDVSPPPLPPRQPGYDYRRPAVDLVDDEGDVIVLPSPRRPRASRPPRFGRDIINPVDVDVVDLAAESSPFAPGTRAANRQQQQLHQLEANAHQQQASQPRRSSSPEITFVRETARPRPAPRRPFSTRFSAYGIDLDTIRRMSEMPLAVAQRRYYDARRIAARAQRLHDDILNQSRMLNRSLPTTFASASPQTYPQHGNVETERYFIGGDGDERSWLQLEYGDGLMFRSPPPPPPLLPPRLRTPVYVPPEPAAEGFTRTVRESEVVVCPNCGHELGTDAEDEVQKQIWVVKQCGHVYCGLCARNRAQKNRRRASPAVKTKPFSKCVVEGCEKNVTQPSTMLQVYL